MGYAYPIDSKVVTNPNGTIDYDRASSSAQLRGLIKSMITNGVNLTESTNLQVMADEESMNLVVKPGYVIIEGALKHFEDDVKVTIGAADTTNPRIDTVVARLNLNEDVRDIVIDVLQGTPSAEPTAPELTRTTSYYEVGLADILVELGTTQISQAVVTDTRLLNSRCGMISAIGEIDTETLFNQLTTDFDNWFESIKGKLGDDVAGGLQMQIEGLADDIDTVQDNFEILEGKCSNNLIWDIDDYLEKDTRTVSTLPRDMTNGYVVKLNDTFYAIGGGKNSGNTLTAQKTYKYVDGEWVEDTVLGTVSAIRKWEGSYGTHRDVSYQCTGGVVSNGNMIYYTTYTYNNTKYSQATINKYDGTTKANETNYFGYYDSGYFRYGTVGIAVAPSSYKTISMGDGCTYDYKTNNAAFGLNIGKTTSGSYKTLPNNAFTLADNSAGGTEIMKVLQPLGQGVYYNNNYVFLVSQRVRHHNYHSTSSYVRNTYSYKYYLVFVNSNDAVTRTVELPDHISIVLGMVAIGDYIYVSYEYSTYRWSYKTNKWEALNLNGQMSSLVEHDGEIHAFGNGTMHVAIKPYRKAKTYAPKDTKIYLPYETAAISTNLQPIEGGYVVTESGNVELKIYDY